MYNTSGDAYLRVDLFQLVAPFLACDEAYRLERSLSGGLHTRPPLLCPSQRIWYSAVRLLTRAFERKCTIRPLMKQIPSLMQAFEYWKPLVLSVLGSRRCILGIRSVAHCLEGRLERQDDSCGCTESIRCRGLLEQESVADTISDLKSRPSLTDVLHALLKTP